MKDPVRRALKIWDQSIPAAGTLIDHYISSLGISGIVLPPTIRFHPKLRHSYTKEQLPALVAAYTDLRQKVVGVSCTYLRSDGRGIARNLPYARDQIGDSFESYICLGLPSRSRMAIADGIETGLRLTEAMQGVCVWVASALWHTRGPIPSSIKELIICTHSGWRRGRDYMTQVNQACHHYSTHGRAIRTAQIVAGNVLFDNSS